MIPDARSRRQLTQARHGIRLSTAAASPRL
jgi:hypothetical protein